MQPDALLDVAAADGDVRVFVEYDRTRRVDKNYDKFRRYEALLAVWWRATDLGCPYVVFVCQDAEHRRRFMLRRRQRAHRPPVRAARRTAREERYPARDRTLFVLESDIRRRRHDWRSRCRRCRRATRRARTRRPYVAYRLPGARGLRSTPVPPGLFPPTRSVLPVRPERNTRPDPPTPEILDPACAERGRAAQAVSVSERQRVGASTGKQEQRERGVGGGSGG